MKYRSPGFKSDILRGNFLPQRTATSRIIAYRFGYVKTELYPNPFHTLDYDTILFCKSQQFFAKKLVQNGDFYFVHKLPLNVVFIRVLGTKYWFFSVAEICTKKGANTRKGGKNAKCIMQNAKLLTKPDFLVWSVRSGVWSCGSLRSDCITD